MIGDGVSPERVVVVDNASQDDSAERLARELPGCAVVALERSVGYAAAANAGAAALAGSSFLILNSDAFVHRPGSIARMLEGLSRSRVGIVVPLLRNPDLTLQRSVRPIDTPLVALVRASGLSRLVPNRHQPSWSTHWDHATSREISAADGAVLLVALQAWEELGGFPSDGGMYAEDTEICWSARRHGWRVWFERGAEFVHLGNASGSRRWSSPERAERWSRAEANLLRRQLPPARAALSILFTAAGLAARLAIFVVRRKRGQAADTRAQLRGYLSALAPRSPG